MSALGVGVWVLGASQVAGQARLPPAAIVAGAKLTQPFGCTSLALEALAAWCPGGHFHSGIDLAAPEGRDVRAAAGGIARWGFDAGGAGLYVVVAADDHTRVLYCHLSSVVVEEGEAVAVGQVIGRVGSSGLSTGPHLHLEVQVDGRAVDPTG